MSAVPVDPISTGISAAVGLFGGGDKVAATPDQNIYQPYTTVEQGGLTINPMPGLPLINDLDLSDPQQAVIAAGGVIIVGMVALAVVRRLGR